MNNVKIKKVVFSDLLRLEKERNINLLVGDNELSDLVVEKHNLLFDIELYKSQYEKSNKDDVKKRNHNAKLNECIKKLHLIDNKIKIRQIKYFIEVISELSDASVKKLDSMKFQELQSLYLKVEKQVNDKFSTNKKSKKKTFRALKLMWLQFLKLLKIK